MTSGAGRTDVGRVRSNNEDAVLAVPEQGLYAVIDGMGGLAAGEVAAEHALRAFRAVPSAAGVSSRKVLVAAFEDARARILRDGEAHPERREMGAVATAVRLDDEGLGFTLAHAGDTRAWLVSAGGVRLLTVDHVERVGEGKPRVSRDLGRRHLPPQWVDVQHVRGARGDLLVLASDGLHDAVPADELERTFTKLRAEKVTPDAAAGRLVALALLHGGPDNISVVVVRLEGFQRGGPTRSRQVLVGVALGLLCAGGGGAATWLLGGSTDDGAGTLVDPGAGGGTPPSRSPLDGDLRGRGPALAEPGSAPPSADASSPRSPLWAPDGASRGGVPPATPSPDGQGAPDGADPGDEPPRTPSPDGQGAPSADAPRTADTVIEVADWTPTKNKESVAPGQRFLLRGTSLRAAEWRLEVGDGAEARLVRSVLTASGTVEIHLGEGARLVLEDVRIASGAFRVTGPPTSSVELAHVFVESKPPGAIVGPRVVDPVDVRPETLLGAPGGATSTPKKSGGAGAARGAQSSNGGVSGASDRRRDTSRGTGGGVAEGGGPPSAPASPSPTPIAPDPAPAAPTPEAQTP